MTANRPGGSPTRPVVLLVDDDEAFRYAMARQLEASGLAVLPAADYREALPILEGGQAVDLMLTDVMLPGGPHGFALAQMARLRRRNFPVIYLTSYHDMVRGQLDLALGKVVYKPVDGVALATEIRSALAA